MRKRTIESAEASTRRSVAVDEIPVDVVNPGASSPYLLIGDHAGAAVPARLARLGLPLEAFDRHIACDLGVDAVGRLLSARLDATFIRQRMSRLVIDCNRDPDHPDSIAAQSDGTEVPGNVGIDDVERSRRCREVFAPYHQTISRTLAQGVATKLVSLHSFTPVLDGRSRPWRLGLLHRNDSPLSRAVLAALRARLGDGAVGDNAPYRMDETDFTVPHHCDPRRLDYLEVEIRQDLIAGPAACATMADLLGDVLSAVCVGP